MVQRVLQSAILFHSLRVFVLDNLIVDPLIEILSFFYSAGRRLVFLRGAVAFSHHLDNVFVGVLVEDHATV